MVNLRESERVEIITLIDNYHDALIPSTDVVRRNDPYRNGKIAPPLIAEHGSALLVRVFADKKNYSLLFDAGWSKTGVLHNLKELGISLDIINTIRYAQKITGVSSIYAVVGGFHLAGKSFEPSILQTIQELKNINPVFICPMHCTGWKATREIARLMPKQFVLSSVGTTLTL